MHHLSMRSNLCVCVPCFRISSVVRFKINSTETRNKNRLMLFLHQINIISYFEQRGKKKNNMEARKLRKKERHRCTHTHRLVSIPKCQDKLNGMHRTELKTLMKRISVQLLSQYFDSFFII